MITDYAPIIVFKGIVKFIICSDFKKVKLGHHMQFKTSLKVLWLNEIDDFETQNYLPALNFRRSTKLHFGY